MRNEKVMRKIRKSRLLTRSNYPVRFSSYDYGLGSASPSFLFCFFSLGYVSVSIYLCRITFYGYIVERSSTACRNFLTLPEFQSPPGSDPASFFSSVIGSLFVGARSVFCGARSSHRRWLACTLAHRRAGLLQSCSSLARSPAAGAAKPGACEAAAARATARASSRLVGPGPEEGRDLQ